MKQAKPQDNWESIDRLIFDISALVRNTFADGETTMDKARKIVELFNNEQRQAVIKECIEALPKRIAVFYKSSVIDVASKIPNKTYRGLIEMGRGEGRYLEANHNRDILEKLLETAV